MATTVIDGYTITATVNPTYGAIFYVVTRPDGSELFDASSSAGLFNGFSNLRRKAEEDGEGRLAYKLTNIQMQLSTAVPALDQQAIKEATPPPVSSGAVVANNQTARTDGATAQNPTSLVTEPLGSVEEPIVVDEGLDPDPITLNISQATPAPDINSGRINVAALVEEGYTPQEALSLAGGGVASPITQPGVGARSDDAATVTGNSTKDIIKSTFQTNTNQRIYTQPNVLDDYASYTYQISWYMLTPAQYNALTKSIKPNTAGWSLLMQSGGAPLSSPTDQPGRSPLFTEDFYLDDLEILSKTPGKGTGMPHNAVEFKFKVVEPNGLTLIDRLYNAVYAAWGTNACTSSNIDPAWGSQGPPTGDTPSPGQQTQAQINQKNHPGIPNHSRVAYCLGIRFYGYDSGGNLIAPATGKNVYESTPGMVGPPNTSNEIIQKLFAFNITELKFRMAAGANSKGVEYMIAGKPIPMNHAFGQARGTVPFQFELTGATVKDILVGNKAQAGLTVKKQEGRVPQSTPPASNVPTAPTTPATATPILGLPAIYDSNGQPTYAYGA